MISHIFIVFSIVLCFNFSDIFDKNTGKTNISTSNTVSYTYDEVLFANDSLYRKLILDSVFQFNFWDTIPQAAFWRKAMNLSEDSAIMCAYSSRAILDIVATKKFSKLSKKNVDYYKDSLRKTNNLDVSERILFTPGKQFFYQIEKTIPKIDTSISVFIENNVDPWYSQSILLIESPNKLQKSNAGAYGSFQLMKGVALKFGLKISKKNDERRDLKRSAFAASQLLKLICIPSVKEILNSKNIGYKETDLWFRLMVMHVYHAGANNVKKVIDKIDPKEGGMSLIFQIWKTEAGAFRNASQNYSQVLIAALLELNRTVKENSKEIRKYCKSDFPR